MKTNILFLLMLMVVLNPYVIVASTDKLADAIEESNIITVKKLLRRLGKLDSKQKKQLLQSADDKLETCTEQATLLNSPWDLGQAIAGSTLGMAMAALGFKFFGGKGPRELERERVVLLQDGQDGDEELHGGDIPTQWVPLVLCSAISAGAFYLAYRGVMCTVAQDGIANARKVRVELEKAEVLINEKPAQKAIVKKA